MVIGLVPVALAWQERPPIEKQIPDAESAAARGKRFVTIQSFARRDTERNMYVVEMQPYQVSGN